MSFEINLQLIVFFFYLQSFCHTIRGNFKRVFSEANMFSRELILKIVEGKQQDREIRKDLVLLTIKRSTAWFPRRVKDLTDQMKETSERCDHRDRTWISVLS